MLVLVQVLVRTEKQRESDGQQRWYLYHKRRGIWYNKAVRFRQNCRRPQVRFLYGTCTVQIRYKYLYGTSTCTVLIRYLYATCTVLVRYLYGTCTVVVRYLYRTFTVLVPYLYGTCRVRQRQRQSARLVLLPETCG